MFSAVVRRGAHAMPRVAAGVSRSAVWRAPLPPVGMSALAVAPLGRRFLSTLHCDADAPSAVVAAAPPSATVVEVSPLSADAVAQAVTDIAVRGDMTALGLGSIWTPVGWIQNALEVLHVNAGLSWVGSVVALTVGVRLFLLPLVVKQMRTAAKLAGMRPELEQIQAESRRAYESGDATSLNMVQTKMAALYRKHEVNPLSMLVPALAQMPVFISAFMALRQLSEKQLTSFAVTAGPLAPFVASLTDSSMGLALINAALFLAAFEIGADTGQQRMEPKMKNFMRVVIAGTTVLTYKLPALVLIYWISSSSFSLVQAGALRYIKPLRGMLGIPAVPANDGKGTHTSLPHGLVCNRTRHHACERASAE